MFLGFCAAVNYLSLGQINREEENWAARSWRFHAEENGQKKAPLANTLMLAPVLPGRAAIFHFNLDHMKDVAKVCILFVLFSCYSA